MPRQALWFAAIFLGTLALVPFLFQFEAIDRVLIVPLNHGIARASGLAITLTGIDTRVQGTTISSDTFSVDIVRECSGAYVMAVFVAAVLAFPSSRKEKLAGIAIGLPGVQAVNLIRVVTLFHVGVWKPDLFEQFHIYVWQTGVIILSMAIWIFWAEVLVRKTPSRA
jgi:exosortase H (IPTLxxWG-CTERM-specific)